jgi:hypothetical protein
VETSSTAGVPATEETSATAKTHGKLMAEITCATAGSPTSAAEATGIQYLETKGMAATADITGKPRTKIRIARTPSTELARNSRDNIEGKMLFLALNFEERFVIENRLRGSTMQRVADMIHGEKIAAGTLAMQG